MSSPILSVHDLSRRFGGVIANDRVSFDVAPGELLSIIGPNGAGKSTLFKSISGVQQPGGRRTPDSGRVLLEGRDITGLPAHRLCRLGLALVFQETEPLGGMTALQNVAIGALVRVESYHEALDQGRLTLERVGLSHRAGDLVADLTLAERKRLEVARALATEPKLLLLDETMAGLTLTEVQQAVALVRSINGTGITVILIEHVLEAVMAVSARIIVLDRGRTIADGTPSVVVRDKAVIEAYLGSALADA